MLWLDLHIDKIRGVVIFLSVVIVVAMLCAGILLSTRYTLSPVHDGTGVYKMDRLTGKVWLLTGDEVRVLEENEDRIVLPSNAPGQIASNSQKAQNEKTQIIHWIKEVVHFDSLYKPRLARTLYDMDLIGWEVYHFQESELIPWTNAHVLKNSTGKWVVGYTLYITHPQKGKLEYGWYWEIFPQDSLVRAINGNALLESRYGLEDRTDPAIDDLLGALPPPKQQAQQVSPEVKQDQASPEVTQAPTPKADVKNHAELFPYVASKKAANFHRRSCAWAQKIPSENLLEFRSIADAKATGRRPCSVCRPR